MTLPKPQKLESRSSIEDCLNGREGFIEPKFDGWRMMAEVTDHGVQLGNRKGNELTSHLPEIAQALSVLPAGTILDGEAISVDDHWGSVQSVLGGNPKSGMKRAVIRFAVWDILSFGASPMTELPYKDRRKFIEQMFEQLLAPSETEAEARGTDALVQLVPSVPATEEAYEALLEADMEGGVVKLAEEPYRPGHRGEGWYRLKPRLTMDVVAMEFAAGGGDRGRARGLGAIKFGQFKDGVLTYRAQCGTGFTDKVALEIWENQDKYLGQVFELRYFGHADKDGWKAAPRGPSFRRWRMDEKTPEECEWEELRR